METLCVILGVLAALGLAAAALGWLLLCRDKRKLKKLCHQMEHFLMYGQPTLPETLNEGTVANLTNQISRMEQLLLHRHEQSVLREKHTTRFVENMAHQMNNSLTAFQIQLDLLALCLSPEEQGRLKKSQACMERLTKEIDRILKSSQLAAGKISMAFEPLELRAVLRACMDHLRPLADARRVTFCLRCPEKLSLPADGFWLSQALENLLKNAVEHTEEGTQVTVSLIDEGRTARIRVEDQGPGIPAEELSTLFARFHRGTVVKAGYGIGLSMAKDIVEAHHGTLTAGNHPPHGAWFEARLPALAGSRAYRE